MTELGKWPYLERFTNDEFLNLLPHLSLEQQFLTQVFVPKKKWVQLLDANLETLKLKCGICNKQVSFEKVKSHVTQNDHLMSLKSNVKQFYHPFYTYGKGDMKLARGELAPQDIRENALHEANTQMRSFKKDFVLAKRFANVAQQRMLKMEESKLIEANMRKKIENPDDMIVKVSLPLEKVAKLLFCAISGEWQPVISHKNLKNKSFHCNICSANCYGIESLNSHFGGNAHRLKQLKLFDVSYEDNSKVNKNCYIRFDNQFSFSIKDDVWNSHRKLIENNSNFGVSNLPKEIAKRIEALNEYVPNTHKGTESSLDQGNGKKHSELSGESEPSANTGHLGVEYVLQIMKNENDPNPKFECCLCEVSGDINKMQNHLLSFDHKKKYLDLHYCDTIKRYESLIGHMSYKEFRVVMGEILNRVSVEVEKHHSRSLPYTVFLSDYKKYRPDLVAEAYALLHATQNRGPSFSNVLSQTDIKIIKSSIKQLAKKNTFDSSGGIIFTTVPKDKIYLNQISHDPLIRIREYNEKLKKKRIPRSSRSLSPAPRKLDSHSLDPRVRSRSPIYIEPEVSLQENASMDPNQNIWDIYRSEIAFAANEIEVAYESYRKNPESHPLYEEEWNYFWQRRKKELEREGIDHRSYNFQPEWVHYFKQRIEVLFGQALQKSRIVIRNRLDIPLDAEEDCQRSHKSTNVDRRMKRNAAVNEEVDIHKRRKRRNSSDFKAFEQNRREFSEEMRTENFKKDSNKHRSDRNDSKIRDNHSNIVHVLRLMIALEDNLGSLGGKVMDLLSNALQLAKIYGENNVEFESKVLTVANCHLLETAMEKLKGILFAGLLEERKIPGFNRVIQHTANLLKYADKMGWRLEDNTRDIQKHMYDGQNRNSGRLSQVAVEKALSDTLMDLVNAPQTTNQKVTVSSAGQSENYGKDHLNLPNCPPPPNIKDSSNGADLFSSFKGVQSNSGLASFNTKLSLDQASQLQKRSRGNDVGNLYNNSFRNNNDTRTNINTRAFNGQNMGGAMNNNMGSSQFRNVQFIPTVGQNNAMYQGGGGGHHHQNWPQWN